jgi:hypothetical protein
MNSYISSPLIAPLVSNNLAKFGKALSTATLVVMLLSACPDPMEKARLEKAQAEAQEAKAHAALAELELKNAANETPVSTLKKICKDDGVDIANEKACMDHLATKNTWFAQMRDDYNNQQRNYRNQNQWQSASGANFWDFAQTAIITGWLAYAGMKLMENLAPKYSTPIQHQQAAYVQRIPPAEYAKMQEAVKKPGGILAYSQTPEAKKMRETYAPPKHQNTTMSVNGKTIDPNKSNNIPTKPYQTPGAQVPKKDGTINQPQNTGTYAQKPSTPNKDYWNNGYKPSNNNYSYKPSPSPSRPSYSSSWSSSRSSSSGKR